MRITVAHLYPRDMDIYGDTGNVTALVRRMEWRGHRVRVQPVDVGAPFDFSGVDVVFGGGGQDSGQFLVGPDLLARGAELRAAADDGLPMLVVCGLYQLFGRRFRSSVGEEVEGIGVFDAETISASRRMTGNISVDSPFGTLVGFENHLGQTTLAGGQSALGSVVVGFGNNEWSGQEGAVTRNVVGTYLHGPVLPRCPALADHLIAVALARRGIGSPLPALDDRLEAAAADMAASRRC